MFTNKDGIHLLTAKYDPSAGYVYYYKINSAGQVITGPITFTSSQGNYPNITGDNSVLYAVYHQGSNIKVHRSTDGGANWSGNISFGQTANSCNGVDAAYSNAYGLHVVWSEKVGSVYESYFYRYQNDSWQNFFNITNTTPIQNGGMPTVALSNNKAHVSVNTGTGDQFGNNVGECYSRDFDYSSWSSPIAITTNPTFSRIDKIFTKGDRMHAFYYVNADPIVLKYRGKSVNDASWSSEITVDNNVYPTNQTHKISISQTADDSIHVCYIRPPFGLSTRSVNKNGGDFSGLSSVSEGGVSHRDHAISSTSNDMFFIYSQAGNFYKYRQYDAVPLAPQNLSWTNTGSPYYHPIISWTAVNEPDVRSNSTGIRIERRLFNGETNTWGNWSEIASVSGENTSYTDNEIYNASGAGNGRVQYKVRSKDLGNNYSEYSNTIDFRFGTSSEKISVLNQPLSYSLAQNYPNPFNPTTKISYSIKDEVLVTLKVYDVLSNEVAELINEKKKPDIMRLSLMPTISQAAFTFTN